MMSAQGLLLVAHGSRDPEAAPIAFDVADGLEKALPGLVAKAAFLELSEPDPATALDELAAAGVTDVVIQPFLLGNAYHSKVDLPEVVEAAAERGLAVELGKVLAPHPALLPALVERIPAVEYDALVLAAAGSSDPEGNAHVVDLARALTILLGVPTTTAYASAAEPTVDAAVAAAREAGAESVAVSTYLLAPGLFASKIRDLAQAAGAVAVSAPLGASQQIIDLVFHRSGLA
jgi:sirohydrochlorin ferrochelatase